MTPLAQRVLAALPQTQCTRCGYPDCASYAAALADGAADLNQCPPGGAEGIRRLAAITGRPERPLSAAHGLESPRGVAVIDENWCIGCTLCLDACPTDAIVGSHKRMHTVIEAHCTGCELCLPVCPVDCIRMENASGERTGWQAWSAEQAHAARERYARHIDRLGRRSPEREPGQQVSERSTRAAAPGPMPGADVAEHADAAVDRKRALIEAALARAAARRHATEAARQAGGSGSASNSAPS